MKRIFITCSTALMLMSVYSCSNSSEQAASETKTDSTAVAVKEEEEANKVIYNIPSPVETFMILKMSNVQFDKSLLNPAANISKYATSYQKSINLGTYSADLAFSMLFKQNQEIETYLKSTSDLKTGLNIEGDMFQSVIKRIKANSNNLDSIMQIISEANINTNLYLSENKMDNTTALISAGAWVEGLYIISNIAEKSKKKDIIGMVADQKMVIKNLIKILEQYSSDKDFASLLSDVKDISSVYETLQAGKPTTATSTDKNIVSIGNNATTELSDEQLKTIVSKVSALRNKLTN